MAKKVAIVNAYYPNYDNEKRILSEVGGEVAYYEVGDDLDKLIEVAHDASAVMTRETKLPKAFIDSLENCEVIVRYGVGVDNIDLEAAKARGIKVANVGGYGTDVVAEHAVALMFAAARRIAKRDRDVREGAWDIGAAEPMYSFVGKTLGVIGLGKIGRAFIQKVSGLGFAKVLGYDPYVTDLDGVELTDLDTIYEQADVISLHTPLTDGNYHMIDYKQFDKMKDTAILVNDARGPLINEAALAEALKNHKIFAAGIDTFEQEPPAADNPLFGLDNVTVSDHTGWYAVESLGRLQSQAAEEVARVFRGEDPLSWVNQ
ncbi:MAG: C-terminal binding protein [Pseudoramibacter sp.]